MSIRAHIQKQNQKVNQKRQNREIDQEFKKEVHELMPQNVLLKISDERLLTASHIKPYIVVRMRIAEASDPKNGLSNSYLG